MTLPSRKVSLLIDLIALDLIAKVSAYLLLPLNQPGDASDLFHFELAINPTGLGTTARALLADASRQNPIFFGALFCTGIAICLLTLKRLQKLTFWRVILSGIAIVGVLALASGFKLLPAVTPEHSVKLLRASQAVLWCVVSLLVSSTFWELGAIFFAAAAVGNFLSFLYPPYAIVDFMWSSILRRTLGTQVFNLADLMWLAGIACFCWALLLMVARKIVKLKGT
jgi:hypothetical protein